MSGQFTDKQMTWVMEVIARKAIVAHRLCIQAVQYASPDSQDEFIEMIQAAEGLIEQMGWMAEHHGSDEMRGDASKWMLPPVYHEAAKKQEAESMTSDITMRDLLVAEVDSLDLRKMLGGDEMEPWQRTVWEVFHTLSEEGQEKLERSARNVLKESIREHYS